MTVRDVKSAKLHLYTVEFDDGLQLSIDKTVWEHSGFSKGSVMDDEQLMALCIHSEQHRAREKALYYLSLRDYGSGELVSKLRQAGIEKELARTTVERLSESGLIDDARYAAALARDMSERKLYPKRRIGMALREKGFDSATIEAVLYEIEDKEEQQALELLCKKRYNKTDDARKREKALAMLARYGFSYAAAKRALAWFDETEDEEFEEELWP